MTFRVFTCNDFIGHYPVGSAAVIVAHDLPHARLLLKMELEKEGLTLKQSDEVKELDLNDFGAVVLNNGDY